MPVAPTAQLGICRQTECRRGGRRGLIAVNTKQQPYMQYSAGAARVAAAAAAAAGARTSMHARRVAARIAQEHIKAIVPCRKCLASLQRAQKVVA